MTGLPKRKAKPAMEPVRLAETSLAHALLGAARACAGVRSGQALPEALAPLLAAEATAQARGALQDIAYRSLRRRGRADALLARLADRQPEPLLRELLVCALGLIDTALDPDTWPPHMQSDAPPGTPPYAPHTVVDQAVQAATALPRLAAAKGFVNAVLRAALRMTTTERAAAFHDLQAQWNYPVWWIERIRKAYPHRWQEILQTGNLPPSLTLRVNRRRVTVPDYLRCLQDAGIAAEDIGPWAVRLKVPLPVTRIPGFSEGWVSVQDEAAQRAAALLDVQDGMRVLDACAAPGGKTGHLLELAQLDLTALDHDADRLVRVGDNLGRLGLAARLVRGDATRPEAWWDGQPYDRILVDVPCTASGIVRRHPDIRWLRRAADIQSLSRLQQQILDALWPLLRPDGKLLLVTCSLFPEESVEQARRFTARHADATTLPAPGQLLPVCRQTEDHDGLFFALFRKAS